MECQKCKKTLSKKGAHFVCQGLCQGTFHKGCVKGLAADLKAGKNRIFCNNCEEDESEDDEGEDVNQGFQQILKDIQKKVSVIPGLKKHLDDIKQSMSVLSEKYDTLLAEQEMSNEKITKLEKTVTSISNKCVYLEKCNIALEQKVHEFEQNTRKHNIEIVGIEQVPGENVKEVVNKVGKLLDVSCDDIEWVRRGPQRKQQDDKPAPITVGFRTSGTGTRDNWLAQRRKLSEVNSSMVTGGTKLNKVYINEDLTKATRSLLWNTKKQLIGSYKYIWVVNGKVLVKKAEGDKSLWLRSESDIRDLLKNK
ncbi:uncharacterized protein LOC123691991 [Colias croceus]|uniref:uncharacterized protein LOC123691991 n=1 Tax=Colias crocea TaxID=72248 RepID=UPI001E279E0C|nr:uncharacterized protein LOC123691991 [Colias croceus]